jgi:hypothetical protein
VSAWVGPRGLRAWIHMLPLMLLGRSGFKHHKTIF